MKSTNQTIGVVGAGSFGIAISGLLSQNNDVLLYSRRQEVYDQINTDNILKGIPLNKNIRATNSVEEMCATCKMIFPVVASPYFRNVIRSMKPYLTPEHFMIHGTKGFDLLPGEEQSDYQYDDFKRSQMRTMSEVIREETEVVRIGALSGPNLASEIIKGLPTASVLASEFDEVIKAGAKVLSGRNFFVFGSHQIRAAELTGALKNVIALASGMLGGRNLGKNSEAMLIIRGFREMILLGELLGSDTKAFFGTAGLGDLIVTATSNQSRNYNCGYRIAQGEDIDTILSESKETIEGIRTLKMVNYLIQKFEVPAPIISVIYKIIFEKRDIETGIKALMRLPLMPDVDFI